MGLSEEDFPRGQGASFGTTVAKKKIKLEALDVGGGHEGKLKLDNLFNDIDSTMTRKRKKSREPTLKELRDVFGRKRGRHEKSTFQVLPHSYDMVAKDMLSLGVILQIHTDSMIVVLPGHVTGKVHITRISGALTRQLEEALESGNDASFCSLHDSFWEGQVVMVKVVELGVLDNGKGHRDVQLSLDPKDLHSNLSAETITEEMTLVGAVKSKEEKGWQVDVGIENVTSFLPYDQVQLPRNQKTLQIGQLIYVKVAKAASGGRVVRVSMKLDKKTTTANDLHPSGINYANLLPNMTLNTFVEDSNESGMKLNVDGRMRALCHVDHSSSLEYSPAQNVTVKVLYIHPNLTTPYVTTRFLDLVPTRSTLQLKAKENILGQLETGRVINSSSRGVFLRLGNSQKNGFVPLSNLGNDRLTCQDKINQKFKPKMEVECRVMKYSPFENMYICTLNSDLISAPFLKAAQVPAGTVLKVSVVSGSEAGVRVSFPPNNLSGWVPQSFISPAMRKSLSACQFAPKRVLPARVMEYDARKQCLVLTFLKELVNSKGKVLSCLENARIGNVGDAVITHVDKFGVVVKTIGGVKGFIPAKLLKASDLYGGMDFQDQLHGGRVIRYEVVNVEMDRGQLLLKPAEVEEIE